MSIQLTPLAVDSRKKRTACNIEPLLFPQPQQLYRIRQQRLHQLAQHNEAEDYLLFAAQIASAQQQIQQSHPFSATHIDLGQCLHHAHQHNRPPLDLHHINPVQHWQQLLDALIHHLEPQLTATPASALAALKATPVATRWQMAQSLLHYQFSSTLNDKALFIWAALSVCWAQMANAIEAQAQIQVQHGEARQFCPVCGCMPVAGIIQGSTQQGLRYLHCALCDTQWHMVRVKCSNCEQSHALNYWSIDSEQAAIKCETCDDCGSYLKLFYLNQQPQQEPVADDLASLILDLNMEQHGYARSTFNPLLFPVNEHIDQQQPSLAM